MSGPVDVLARYENERADELAELRGLIRAGVVSKYEKELADLTEWYREAVKACAGVAELIEAARSMSEYIGSGLPVAECFIRKARLDIALTNAESAS